jgi:hypothetical protein
MWYRHDGHVAPIWYYHDGHVISSWWPRDSHYPHDGHVGPTEYHHDGHVAPTWYHDGHVAPMWYRHDGHVAPTWYPHDGHVISSWWPRDVLMMATWLPLSSWWPRGTHRISSRWPRGTHVISSWWPHETDILFEEQWSVDWWTLLSCATEIDACKSKQHLCVHPHKKCVKKDDGEGYKCTCKGNRQMNKETGVCESKHLLFYSIVNTMDATGTDKWCLSWVHYVHNALHSTQVKVNSFLLCRDIIWTRLQTLFTQRTINGAVFMFWRPNNFSFATLADDKNIYGRRGINTISSLNY